MLLYYEECGIFKGFGCPTYEEEYDRCTNFQFPRQSAKLSNVSNKKNVLVLAAVFHSVAMEYLIVYNNGRSKRVGKNECTYKTYRDPMIMPKIFKCCSLRCIFCCSLRCISCYSPWCIF